MPDDIKVNVAEAIELKPGHNYLITFDREKVRLGDVYKLVNNLAVQGIMGIAFGMLGDDGVQVIDVTTAREKIAAEELAGALPA